MLYPHCNWQHLIAVARVDFISVPVLGFQRWIIRWACPPDKRYFAVLFAYVVTFTVPLCTFRVWYSVLASSCGPREGAIVGKHTYEHHAGADHSWSAQCHGQWHSRSLSHHYPCFVLSVLWLMIPCHSRNNLELVLKHHRVAALQWSQWLLAIR